MHGERQVLGGRLGTAMANGRCIPCVRFCNVAACRRSELVLLLGDALGQLRLLLQLLQQVLRLRHTHRHNHNPSAAETKHSPPFTTGLPANLAPSPAARFRFPRQSKASCANETHLVLVLLGSVLRVGHGLHRLVVDVQAELDALVVQLLRLRRRVDVRVLIRPQLLHKNK